MRADPSAAVASRLELVRPVRVDRSASGSAAAAERSGLAWATPVPSSEVADGGSRRARAVAACGEPQTLQ